MADDLDIFINQQKARLAKEQREFDGYPQDVNVSCALTILALVYSSQPCDRYWYFLF